MLTTVRVAAELGNACAETACIAEALDARFRDNCGTGHRYENAVVVNEVTKSEGDVSYFV